MALLGAAGAIGSYPTGYFTGTVSAWALVMGGGLAIYLLGFGLTAALRPAWGPSLPTMCVWLASGVGVFQVVWAYLSVAYAPEGQSLMALARIGPWLLMPHAVAFLICPNPAATYISLAVLGGFGLSMLQVMADPEPYTSQQALHLITNLLAAQVMAAVLLRGLVRVRRQLQQRQASLGRLSQMADTDALTGLSNRDHFTRCFEQARSKGRANAAPMALVMLDIDHFKLINDVHGHLVGDEVLHTAARVISDGAPPGAKIARWGGEEFAVLCPGMPLAHAVDHAERMRMGLSAHAWPQQLKVTASLGVAPVSATDKLADAIKRADAALYDAKRSGRDRVCVAADETAQQKVA